MIRRQVLPVPKSPESFETPSLAIHSSTLSYDTWLSQSGVNNCLDLTIEGVLWCDNAVEIVLSGGAIVEIGCSISGVTCRSIGRSELFPTVSAEPAVLLEWSSGRLVTWRRRELLESLVGKQLARLYPSSGTLFLYPRGGDILCFGVIQDSVSHELLLYWDISD
jgi:hypothetical protein